MSKTQPMKTIVFLSFFVSNFIFSQQKIDSIPFHMKNKLLVFKGKVNGYETNFGFDTGASIGILNSSQANQSNAVSKKEKKANDSNKNSAKIKMTTTEEVTIGSFAIKKVKNGIYDMPFLSCNDIYLLGGNVINELHWKIDFDKKILYVSKDEFLPSQDMLPLSIAIKNNRHFADFTINGKVLEDCLIDFGYDGIFEASAANDIMQQLKTEKVANTIKGQTFSMGLTSSMTKNTDHIVIDTFQLGNKTLSNVPLEIEENTDTKVGLKFFNTIAAQLIINPEEKKYYLKYSQKTINRTLGFDADCYLKDHKLIVVRKIDNELSSAKNLEIGEEIKSINGKTATDFTNECAYLTWKSTQTENTEITIVKMNDEEVIVKKQSF